MKLLLGRSIRWTTNQRRGENTRAIGTAVDPAIPFATPPATLTPAPISAERNSTAAQYAGMSTMRPPTRASSTTSAESGAHSTL
jgi:hypothetical protein